MTAVKVSPPPRRAVPSGDSHVGRSLIGWVVGFSCSVLADQMFFLALTWAALQTTTPGHVGLVLAAGSIPRLLILLLGGVVADSTSPKRIIIGTDSGRAVTMAVAAAVLFWTTPSTWGLVVLALVIGALDGLFLPAVAALPVRIAPAHLMGRVAALRTLTQRIGLFGGGPLAGWLIYLYGPGAAFLGSAALFALSVGSLLLVTVRPGLTPPPPPRPAAETLTAETLTTPASTAPTSAATASDPGPSRPGRVRTLVDKAADGLTTVRDSPVIATMLLLIGFNNLGFSGPFTTGIPLLSAANGWGARGAGLLIGAFGVGAAASGFTLFLVRYVPKAGNHLLIGSLLMAVSMIGIGLVGSLTLAMLCSFLMGVASGIYGTLAYALLLTATPEHEIGRVMSFLSLTLEGVAPISFMAAGFIAALLSPQWSFLLGGGLSLLATLLFAARPLLRRQEMARPQPKPAVAT
ncbi:MAG: major facilitator superfamily 1 [Friedmanniella sp.]|nr:major facilitator superfamily 1 [Friedmanniella sp.]